MKTSLRLVEEYHATNVASQADNQEVGPLTIWKPPARERYKVNVDGAVFKHRKKASISVLIRNETGEVIAALSKLVNAPLGAAEIEAKAMEARVLFASDVGIRKAVFKGDSLTICKALQGEGVAPLSIQNVLRGTMDLTTGFRNFSFFHVKR